MAAVAAAGCLALALVAPPAGAQAGRYPGVEDVLRYRPADSRSDAEIVRELVELGPEGQAGMFAVLLGEDLGLIGDSFRESSGEAAVIDRLVIGAFQEHRVRTVLTFLETRLGESPSLEERLTALRVIAAVGRSETLKLTYTILLGIEEPARRSRIVHRPVVDALAAILRHDAASWKVLSEIDDKLPEDLVTVTIDAALEAEQIEGVAWISKLLGRSAFLDERAISGMAELHGNIPWKVGADPRPILRGLLQDKDPARRAAAARAVGGLRDRASVPRLIVLLEDSERRVQRAARSAIVRTAGSEAAGDPDGWHEWWKEQEAWYTESRTRLLDELASGDPGSVTAATRELARRPLFRDESCEALGDALHGAPTTVAVAICSTIQRLGSRTAVPALVDALLSDDPEVSAAAWRALRALTGEELPLEVLDWQRYVHG